MTAPTVTTIPAPAVQHISRKLGADGNVYATAEVYTDGLHTDTVHLLVDVSTTLEGGLPDQTKVFRAADAVRDYAETLRDLTARTIVERVAFPRFTPESVEASHRFTILVSTPEGRS